MADRKNLDVALPFPAVPLDSGRDSRLITSTDYFYGLLGLGEGPIYKINPNGPTDLEFNDSSIDDLINYDTNKLQNSKAQVVTVLGNPATPMPVEFNSYFGRSVNPQALGNSVELKKGNVPGIPAVELVQNTSANSWDALEFNFIINGLFSIDDNGNRGTFEIKVRISLTDHLGIKNIPIGTDNTNYIDVVQNGITQTPVKFSSKVEIPVDFRSPNGYRFKIQKISDDVDSTKVQESIILAGWDEISYDTLWYPRTSMLGVILKAYAEYNSSIPNITSLIKGLLVKIPSNYNQPTIVTSRKRTLIGSSGSQVTSPLSDPIIFDTPGLKTFIVPEGITEIIMDFIGGGGGCGINNCAGQRCSHGSGGGGSGGFARKSLVVSPGQALQFKVGQGGSMGKHGYPTGLGIGGYSLYTEGKESRLARTFVSVGDRTKWTWSGWVKRAAIGTYQSIFHGTVAGGFNGCYIWINPNNSLEVYELNSSNQFWLISSQTFTDLNAWTHFTVVYDSGQATSSDRIKIYVDGTLLSSFTTSTYPSLNYASGINNSVAHYIGANSTTNTGFRNFYEGFLAYINFIDGQALAATDFGEISSTSNRWVPKTYSGTYGTNGFYLDFSLSTNGATTPNGHQLPGSDIGTDVSSNSNDWTPTFYSTPSGYVNVDAYQSEDNPNYSIISSGGLPAVPYETSPSNPSYSDAGGIGGTGFGGDINTQGLPGSSGGTGGNGIYVGGKGGCGVGSYGTGLDFQYYSGAWPEKIRAVTGAVRISLPGSEPSIEPTCVKPVKPEPPPPVYEEKLEFEIDWRHVEGPITGAYSIAERGYYLQKTGSTVQHDPNPQIYVGTWDGTFVNGWTQNPVWIIYDLLTNTRYGLNIPEEYVDKFKFYKVAQYCDAVNPKTGKFEGVSGFADGTFRYKPKDFSASVTSDMTPEAKINTVNRETQIGLTQGTVVKERRFVCNISINAQKQVIDIINQITSLFRGILIYTGGKISLNVDLPDELPVAVFNETNILKESFQISGVKESDLISGVEVAFMDPTNHYKKELIKIDDPDVLKELGFIENVKQVDLIGCDRRSQAYRFGQYLLASNKYIRRKVTFKTGIEAISLSVGDVISVSQRIGGVKWGYGGRVVSNSSVSASNIVLEHFTAPAITSSVFTSNSYPIALRVINRDSEKTNIFLINESNLKVTGNTGASVDMLELKAYQILDPDTKVFKTFNSFNTSNCIPVKNDIWTLGEVNPTSYATSTSDKLFKIAQIERDPDEIITINAFEYISNVYTDSDSLINYSPPRIVPRLQAPSPVTEIPPVSISVTYDVVQQPDGSIAYDIIINPANTDYPYGSVLEVYIAEVGTTEPVSSLDNTPVCSVKTDLSVTGSLSGGVVWGSNPYTDDSDWNKAAVHAGLVAVGETATIEFYNGSWMNGGFTGTTQNGITTLNWTTGWCGVYIRKK